MALTVQSTSDTTVTVVTPPVPPAAPSNFTASTALTNRNRLARVNLSWTDNSNIELGFVVQRATDPGFAGATTFNLLPNATSLADTRLARGTTYYYQIRAWNNFGTSAWVKLPSITTP